MSVPEQDSLLEDASVTDVADADAAQAANAVPADMTEPDMTQPDAAQPDAAQADAGPLQGEMPFALVYGQAFTKLPQDLYIPPDALEVILEAFEGPLDLLLYLIKRQNLDILDIPVAQITTQYMEYVELMKNLNLELAAEYLVMAALLGEIKSRMLLPRQAGEEDEELDPRAELIRRLQEYERYKKAAEDIEVIPRVGRDIHLGTAEPPQYERARAHPEVDLKEVLLALRDVLHRADMFESHQVTREKLSTRERMTQVLERLARDRFVPFVSLFTYEEGRLGVVVTFLAILELVKESLIELVQSEPCGPIHVKARAAAHETGADSGEWLETDAADVDDAYEIRTPAADAISSTDGEFVTTGPEYDDFDPALLQPDAASEPDDASLEPNRSGHVAPARGAGAAADDTATAKSEESDDVAR